MNSNSKEKNYLIDVFVRRNRIIRFNAVNYTEFVPFGETKF